MVIWEIVKPDRQEVWEGRVDVIEVTEVRGGR